MDELVNQVASRAGISQEQAQQAVNTVAGFLKDRLPGPMAAQVDNVLQGGSASDGGGGIGSAIGGLFKKRGG